MAADISQTATSRDGAGFRLTLTCPKCEAVGWVEWKSLSHSIRCPCCECQFLIAPNGKVRSHADLPQTRFRCPRCGQSGSIPSMLAVRGAECIGCKLPLVTGPDQQLHGVKEAADLRRIAQAQNGKQGFGDWLTEKFQTADGRWQTRSIFAWSVLLIGALVAGAIGLLSLFDTSPEARVRQFTGLCLAGNWSAAEGYFENDDVQRAEFDRWRMRHFTSIVDAHRPRGDDVQISVEPFKGDAQSRTFRVTMTSDFLGSRTHSQSWYERDGKWQFSPQQTLEENDGVVGSRRRTVPQ